MRTIWRGAVPHVLHALRLALGGACRSLSLLRAPIRAESKAASDQAVPPDEAFASGLGSRSVRTAGLCAAVFLAALGTRLLHWQDSNIEASRGGSMLTGLIRPYQHEADRMLRGDGVLIPRDRTDFDEACILAHPPGYAIVIAAVYWIAGRSNDALTLLQIICDTLAVVLVFLIAARMLPVGAAVISALLAAVSPHLAYYSLWRSPDSLAVLPILLAVYLLLRSLARPGFWGLLVVGASLGLSCWLRTNGLFLAPFLALATLPLFSRGRRLRCFAALICGTLIAIAPVTIRNLILFHEFIPLSLSTGLNLIEGIGEMDREGRFGFPSSDAEIVSLEAEWYGRPDYSHSLWVPDGPARDRARFRLGLGVVQSHPGWFAGAMLQRARFMLRYNDAGARGWPFSTASAPFLSPEAPFAHSIEIGPDTEPVWWVSPGDFSEASQEVNVSTFPDGDRLLLRCDKTAFGDQIASHPITVRENTDYLIRISTKLLRGEASARVTTSDRRVTLGSALLHGPEHTSPVEDSEELGGAERWSCTEELVPFSSGRNTSVRLVLSNNGTAGRQPVLALGQTQLFQAGATPYAWTRYPRWLAMALQKKMMTTARLIPFILAGIVLLISARRWRALLVLGVVPVYYLLSHSAFSIEYRYILAIHYFVFMFAGTAVFCVASAVARGLSQIREKLGAQGAAFEVELERGNAEIEAASQR
jgi:hypothetical protein